MNRTTRLLFVLTALLALSVFLAASAGAASVPFRGKPWPGGKIKVYNGAPKSYEWSINYAIKHYSEIGAKVKFVKVKKKKQANLVVIEDKKLKTAGLATLGYPGKRRKATVRLLHDSRDKYAFAGVVAHEFGHVLGLDHPKSKNLCAMMNQYFELSCSWIKNDGVNWVCGIVQPADLKPLQKKYGKRKSKVKSRLCKIPAGELTPTMTSSFTYNGDGTWQTLQWGDSPARTFVVPLNFIPFAPINSDLVWSYELALQRFEGSCAAATEGGWSQIENWADGTAQSLVDPASGLAADRLHGYDSGGTVCYRLESRSYTKYGSDPAPVHGPTVEVVVPSDPSPIDG